MTFFDKWKETNNIMWLVLPMLVETLVILMLFYGWYLLHFNLWAGIVGFIAYIQFRKSFHHEN